MRNFSIFIFVALLLSGRASAEQSASEKAYTLTLMCQVVAAHFDDQPAFRKAADAARRMGRTQGYSDEKISKDAFTMTEVLGVREREQPGTLDADRDGCRKIGLAS